MSKEVTKKQLNGRAFAADPHTESTADILADARKIIETCQSNAYRAVNTALIQRNWLLGRRIVEEELLGGNKKNYGKEIVKNLSKELTSLYGRGYDQKYLYNFIQFYKAYPDFFESPIRKSITLTWTHYNALIRVSDKAAREWYEKEAIAEAWSVRALSRNIGTQYYCRLMQSPRPAEVEAEMAEKTKDYKQDKLEFIKNPVVAEFLGLAPDIGYLESELEKAIIDNLQKFLLEMGKGYAFVDRQKRIHTTVKDYFIDLVFYNFELDCFVLIDLKTGTLDHKDVGQMDMYMRMYDEMALPKGKNPTLGIILCSETDESVVHYSVLNDKDRMFTAKYLLYVPTEEDLRAEIEAQKAIYYSEHQTEGTEAGDPEGTDR